MSYCRFSSDNHRSDVYCYAHVDGGWVVHVAKRRHVGDTPIPEMPGNWHEIGVDSLTSAIAAQREWLDKARLEPIGLSRDGEDFSVGTPGEAADLLESLRDEGYRVPAYAIEELRREAREGDAT